LIVQREKQTLKYKAREHFIGFSSGILRETAFGEWPACGGQRSPGKLVGGDGAGASPFADGGDVFGARDAERLRGGKFGEENLRGELLLGGEGV